MDQQTLNALRDSAYKTACKHGFHDQKLSNEHWFCLIVSELMEAVEADRSSKRACTSPLLDIMGRQSVCKEEFSEEWYRKTFPELYDNGIKGTVEEELADAAIALPEGADWDVIDLAQSLPDSSEGSAIADFRHLCFNDHILTPEKEDERTVRLRELRQEARQNNGVLPLGTLKHLYEQMGTKKAVEELLKEGGPELVRTVKEWKMVRVNRWNEK